MQALVSSRALRLAPLRATSQQHQRRQQPQHQRGRVAVAVARTTAINAFSSAPRRLSTPPPRAALVVAAAASTNSVPLVTRDEGPVSEEAFSVRRLAWASFWSQLALSTVSAVVLFFTAAQSRPTWAAQGGVLPLPFPFLCTAVGVAGALVSTALAFGLTRVTRAVIVRGESVKRSAVVAGALAATRLNLWSTGAALVGLQATVGSLVSSTLLTATTNPFVLAQNAGNAAARAPVALDVFAVQASANVLGSHFVSLIFATILIRTLARAPPSRGPPRRRSRRDEEEYEFSLPASSSSSAAPPAAAAKSAFESAQDFKKGAY